MKRLLSLILFLASFFSEAQILRSKSGDTTSVSPGVGYGAFSFQTSTKQMWMWNGLYWREIKGGSVTALSNGLTLTGTTGKLGGPLTQHTSITGAYDFSHSHANINLDATNDVTLQAGNFVNLQGTSGILSSSKHFFALNSNDWLAEINNTGTSATSNGLIINSSGASGAQLLSLYGPSSNTVATFLVNRIDTYKPFYWQQTLNDAASTDKFLLYDNSSRQTLKLGIGSGLSVSGGNLITSGGLTGSGVNNRATFWTGVSSIGGYANFLVDAASDRLVTQNDAATLSTYTYGGEITLDEPSTSDFATLSAGSGADPYLVLDNGPDVLTVTPTNYTLSSSGNPTLAITNATAGNLTLGSSSTGDILVTSNDDLTLSGDIILANAATLTLASAGNSSYSTSTGGSDITIDPADDLFISSDVTDLSGTIKIQGGSPGSGKVLVSDADGDASWQSGYSLNGYGTYTPTLTNVGNVSASTSHQCQYHYTGQVVTLSGAIEVTPSSAPNTSTVGISLPMAGSFANTYSAVGTGFGDIITLSTGTLKVTGDTSNNRLNLEFTSITNTSGFIYFHVTYHYTPL